MIGAVSQTDTAGRWSRPEVMAVCRLRMRRRPRCLHVFHDHNHQQSRGKAPDTAITDMPEGLAALRFNGYFLA